MQFQFYFKQMESSEALKSYAQDKIENLVNKFVTKPIEVHVTFAVDKTRQSVNCVLVGGDGFNINEDVTSHDMYVSIDKMASKLGAQLRKKKEKLKHHKTKRPIKMIDQSAPVEDNYSIDAEDIIKYEIARRKRSA